MNESEKTGLEQSHRDQSNHNGFESSFGGEIARVLSTQAEHVHFSPSMHAQVMQHLPLRPVSPRRRVSPLFSLAAVLLLILLIGSGAYLVKLLQPVPQALSSLVFRSDGTLNTPAELALGGQLVSLDPTGRHIIYGVTNQPGVMYTTNLTDPLAQNQLAMRFAREASWSPDGSALVTTIAAPGASLPQLALVPIGQYMHVLGQAAQTAGWLPSSATTITYITQQHEQTTLWEMAPNGGTPRVMDTFTLAMLAQHMSWSPDSRFLAILGTPGRDPLQGTSSALYLFDALNHSLIQLVAPSASALGDLAWSPNGHLLTYEQRDSQGQSVLHTLDPSTRQTLFTLSLRHSLLGMSWSPDSHTLVYSDGGTLHARNLTGTQVIFASLPGTATSPFWLDGQHILYLAINHQRGQLVRLSEQTQRE